MNLENFSDAVILEMSELCDRNSPEGEPDAMIANANEVRGCIERAFDWAGGSFQSRVAPWMLGCFGEMIAGDREERNHRFIEEALELIQACGCSASEAHQLVDYVFGRPVGEPHRKSGASWSRWPRCASRTISICTWTQKRNWRASGRR